MKKMIFIFLSCCLLYVSSNAQYCGNSSPSVCTPTGFATPGLSPEADSLAPITLGNESITIQFKNFDTIRFSDTTLLTIDSLVIDSITNLPAGLCWASTSPNNNFQNQEDGCLHISGNCTAAPGQYRIFIYVRVGFGYPFAIPIEAGDAGLFYYIRVNPPADTVVRPIDTSGQAAGTNRFTPYYAVGVKEIGSGINTLNVAPNPFNERTLISFNSEKEETMTERITSIIGSEVSRKELQVKVGENSFVVERGSLPPGVYFYSLSDTKTSFTRRIVVTE